MYVLSALPVFFQGRQDASDLLVHVRDDRVVFLAMDAHGIFGARPGCQILVAQKLDCRSCHSWISTSEKADVRHVGILGQEVLRHLDPFLRIHVHESLGRLARVVRGIEGQVHEERLVSGCGLFQELRWRRRPALHSSACRLSRSRRTSDRRATICPAGLRSAAGSPPASDWACRAVRGSRGRKPSVVFSPPTCHLPVM